MRRGLTELKRVLLQPAPKPIQKHWFKKIFEPPSTRERRKLVDRLNRENHLRWKRQVVGESALFSIVYVCALFGIIQGASFFGRQAILLLSIPLLLLVLWAASTIPARHPQPDAILFIETDDRVGFALGGTGLIAGAVTGAMMGSHIGLAMGPLGAMAGTIPGALIGGIIGLLGGVQTSDMALLERADPPSNRKKRLLGGGGCLAGAASGAWIGSGVGLALGPAGAIVGTVPGAVIGGTIGLLSGLRLARS